MSRAAIALALLFAVAPLARGDDFKWDPKVKHKDAVGEKSTQEGETLDKQKVKVTLGGQVAQEQDQEIKTVFKASHEVKAVEKDKASEEVLKFEKFERTTKGEDEVDKSLEGQTVIIKKKDGKKSYTLPDDKDGKVSDGAKKFIEQYFAKKKKKHEEEGEENKNDEDDDEGGIDKLFPEKPVGNDEEWTGDPEKVAKGLLGESVDLDKEKSSVKGKLTNVHDDGGIKAGHVDVKVVLKLKYVPGLPMQVEWTDGGTFEINMTYEGSLELLKSDGATISMDGGLVGKAKFDAQGQKAVMKMDVKTTVKMTKSPAK